MPSKTLEGESYFILKELDRITQNKKVIYNPEQIPAFSLFNQADYYVFFDPDKELIETLSGDNFIVCFMEKNVDLRADYIKKLKSKTVFTTYEPIPTTDPGTLLEVFPEISFKNNTLPFKKNPLKYKGQKQNYEWFDLNLIDDLYQLGDNNIYGYVFDSFFDIWRFTDHLWTGNNLCLSQIKFIDDTNFENYFNRIRETSKDYLEILQTGANNYREHKRLLPQTVMTNEYRFEKVREKVNLLKKNYCLSAISEIDTCLKNVRLGSNPKLELVKLFYKFKQNVK
jgi:hypothetical protein